MLIVFTDCHCGACSTESSDFQSSVDGVGHWGNSQNCKVIAKHVVSAASRNETSREKIAEWYGSESMRYPSFVHLDTTTLTEKCIISEERSRMQVIKTYNE